MDHQVQVTIVVKYVALGCALGCEMTAKVEEVGVDKSRDAPLDTITLEDGDFHIDRRWCIKKCLQRWAIVNVTEYHGVRL